MSENAPRILLDLSRLLWRVTPPTGIERVELAYAQHFIATAYDRLDFVALAPYGRIAPLPKALATNFIGKLAARWHDNVSQAGREARQLRIARFIAGGRGVPRRNGPAVYLLVSHHHLDRPATIATLKTRTGAKFVCMVHDLIPYAYPEYARPGHAARHARRMETVARLADAVIFNSAATRDDFAPFLTRAGRMPPSLVAPLGVSLTPAAAVPTAAPYFLCVGTIEPRKNHLLLLNLWREFAEKMGARAPRLVLIGRRGWENENIVDMIERCRTNTGVVEEHNTLADAELARLLKGARALLLPSFAEGFGLPVAEALASGVPVLCSDLPALRELGGDVPEYFSPLDGAAWRTAILDYAEANSSRREMQLARISKWRAPTWQAHFTAVENLIGELARRGATA